MSGWWRSGTPAIWMCLDARGHSYRALSLHGEVAFDDLAVIPVELHLQVRRADFVANRLRVVPAVQEEAGHVACVDRLDGRSSRPPTSRARRDVPGSSDTPAMLFALDCSGAISPAITCSLRCRGAAV